jgi:hypothetical protein
MTERPWGQYDDEITDPDWYIDTLRSIVNAVAQTNVIIGGAEGTPIACFACRAQRPGKIWGDHPFEHKPDCWWIAARRLAGLET